MLPSSAPYCPARDCVIAISQALADALTDKSPVTRTQLLGAHELMARGVASKLPCPSSQKGCQCLTAKRTHALLEQAYRNHRCQRSNLAKKHERLALLSRVDQALPAVEAENKTEALAAEGDTVTHRTSAPRSVPHAPQIPLEYRTQAQSYLATQEDRQIRQYRSNSRLRELRARYASPGITATGT